MALKKLITGALAAVTLPWRHGRRRPRRSPSVWAAGITAVTTTVIAGDGHHYRDRSGAIVAAGVAGLAIGAIIGSSSQPALLRAAAGLLRPTRPAITKARVGARRVTGFGDPYIGRRVPVETQLSLLGREHRVRFAG